MRDIYRILYKSLGDILTKYSIKIAPPWWEIPKDKKYGDFSTMLALKMASFRKQEPLEIAREIKAILQDSLKGQVQSIEIINPGFVNIFISRQGLLNELNRILQEKDEFFKEKRSRNVLLEFVSANPTGPLSIAHGRQAIVGDVIGKVLEFFGNKVVREYYLNDCGRQISLLVQSVEERIKEAKHQEFQLPQDGYRGEYVKDIALEACDVSKTDLEKFILSQMTAVIQNDLSRLGIEFDNWFSQRKLITSGQVDKALSFLEGKELIYEKDGALWFSSSKFGDDKDRVLRKSNGELTYFVSDIAYHRNKIKRKFDKIINLWGPDHHGYIARVKSAIKALGFNDNILEVVIIQLVTIKTKLRMSRRAGTAIMLSDLIDEVGKDAARFYYLLRRNSSPLEFDMDLAKQASFDNPLYYIQYAHARIMSIFRKAGVKDFTPLNSSYLGKEDLSLVRDLLRFTYCLDRVYYNLEPVFLIEYLKSLAASFHRFYEHNRVLSEDKNKTLSRLNLLEAVRLVLSCGLKNLGITPWDTM